MRIFWILIIFLCLSPYSTAQAQYLFGNDDTPVEKTAPSEPSPENGIWFVRCDRDNPDHHKTCEIFQRIIYQESGTQFLEFAVHYPNQFSDQAEAVINLPLGVWVEKSGTIQIDQQSSLPFNVRYCIASGCLAFVPLSSQVITDLKQGQNLKVSVPLLNGDFQKVDLGLKGFKRTIKEIEE
jgi:invasion protein IalB